jgi:mannobiose 2-epimerase
MKIPRRVFMIGAVPGMAWAARAPESWIPLQGRKTERGGSREQGAKRPTKDQDLGPQELRLKIDRLLRDELTQRWYPHAIDRRRGGFHQTMARDWSVLRDENVSLVYQARLTWTAAAFAEHSPPDHDAFAQYARHGIEFLDQRLRDREFGGFHWALAPEGRLDPKLGTDKFAYGLAFLIFAASKVRQVTGDERALKVAGIAFDWLEEHAHDPKNGGYLEAFRRDGTPILYPDRSVPNAPRADPVGTPFGHKSTDCHLHLLEAFTALSRVDKREIVMQRLREVFLIFQDRFVAAEGALHFHVTTDWRPVPAPDSFGHDVELAHLLVGAAHALGIRDDPKTWQVARRLVDHALDWGWDDRYGGLYERATAINSNKVDQTKVWWAQAEALNGLLLMHWRYGDQTDRYWIAFSKVWNFIERRLIDPIHGGWYWSTTREGRLIGDGIKANEWKANYHTARALIFVARLLAMIPDSRPRDHPRRP